MAGLAHSLVKSVASRLVATGKGAVKSAWIMATGYWDDAGAWDDNANWKDG